MWSLVDSFFLDILEQMFRLFRDNFSSFISLGQAFGAVLVLLVVAEDAFAVILGKRSFDMQNYVRPLILSLVLALWGGIVEDAALPGAKLEAWARSQYYSRHNEIDALREKRSELRYKRLLQILELKAQGDLVKKKATEENSSFWENLVGAAGEALKSVLSIISSVEVAFLSWAYDIIEMIIMFVGETFYRFSVYSIFFIKSLSLGILGMTGPIAIGLSVFSVWKDAWAEWLMRFISVSLYGFVAYLIMYGCTYLFRYGIECEIKSLTDLPITSFAQHPLVTIGMTISAYFAGGKVILMTPEIASWIVPSNSSHAAGQFISGLSGSMKGAATAPVKLAKKSASGGVA